MKWLGLSKKESADICKKWNDILEKKNDIDTHWKMSSNLNDDYNQVKKELEAADNEYKSNNKDLKISDYDIEFGIKLYQITEKYNLSLREAAADDIWRYLSIKVVPKLVYMRFFDSNKINIERFFSRSSRIWLKTCWWYIHLSLQIDSMGIPDYEETRRILIGNSTDDIVQLVERTGFGYRVDLCRAINKKYSSIRIANRNTVFRKVMKLNTIKTKIIEPELYLGGVEGYVEDLFAVCMR